MGLIEEFLKITQRYSSKVKSFVLNHCEYLDSYVISESMDIASIENSTLKITNEIRNEVIKQATLSKLRNYMKKQPMVIACNDCMLCNRKAFINKRKLVTDLLDELQETKIIWLKDKLNKLSKNYLEVNCKILKDNNGNYYKNYGVKNLFQEIISDLIDYIIKELNRKDRHDKFFYQIAKLLISTKNFNADIKKIRTKYLDKGPGGQDFPDYVRKVNDTYDVTHEIVSEEINLIMQKYNLNYRWGAWLHNILYHDINKKPNYFYNNIPYVYVDVKNKIVIKDRKLFKEVAPALIGDENKEAIVIFNKLYNQNLNYVPVKKIYKPMQEKVFEKYLRWYILKQKGIKYREIFKIDKENFPQDWDKSEEYKKDYVVIRDRLNKGLRYLEYRIYKMKK